jgi:hypothetical protein
MGCAKETTTRVNTNSNSSSQSTVANDEVTVNNEFDQALDDAIMILCNHNTSITGAFPPDSISPSVYEIDYYGKEADGTKTRSGNDSIHLNTASWPAAGAIANVSFGDINNKAYEVSFTNNQTSLTFFGNASITNVSGGLLQNLTPGDSIVIHVRATISFTFNDNAAIIQLFTWNIDRIRTFTISSGSIYASNRGDTTINGLNNIGTWGTDRFGNSFYSIISTSIVQNISTASLSYNPLSGTENIQGLQEPITSIYGVNTQGSAVTSGTPYGFYISWINNGGLASDVLPYYY